MNRSADDRRDILRAFMREQSLKAGPWAKRSHVSQNSLYNFLNGHSESLDSVTYAKLARTAEVPVWRLTGELPEAPSPTSVWVAGYVEAGAFRDAIEWDRSRWYGVDVPIPRRFQGRAKALETRGPSMNRVYPEGTIVMWVETLDFRAAKDGDRVIVYRYRDDDAVEATVKTLRQTDGKAWLWPESYDPMHQAPVDTDDPGSDCKSIEIRGIVIGSYRPEVY
jgi:phage repressor protein C with HTH and peptisase S24 domain